MRLTHRRGSSPCPGPFVDELKEVDPPEDKQEDYDTWIRVQEEEILPELEKALRERDRKALDLIDTSAADSLAGRLGFDDCD